ncbi:interleukin-1 receptor type 2 [Pempheris klunzingeri]|uniref:interleukin-1 receptor type 2 n=1 Tax=Pempheris klunzingeri TaxID=3127111 RepID=UPI003980DC29
MISLVLMLAVVVIECVNGKPTKPPLPMKDDGCYLVESELEISSLEGEAIILSFPIFMRALEVRKIFPPTDQFFITKNNVTYDGEGRVQQHDKQLWLLPSQVSDSGEFVCTYRNENYCVTGNITLQVYGSSSVDMKKWSFPISATVGEELTFRCPSISDFNSTGRPIEWYKDSSPTSLQQGRGGSFRRDRGNLLLPAVRRAHAGVYTCQLRVLINNQLYKVSRAIVLSVNGLDPDITPTPTVPDPSVTSNPGLISSSTVHTPTTRPPVIVSPLNGTIFEGLHGSGLELFCRVLTECETADSTVVTWLVNGQSVESSHLDERALQGGRRVTRVSEGCHTELRLIVVTMTDEDVKTELKCVAKNQGGTQEVVTQLQLEDSTFTWLVVGIVAASCFLTVVSVFLYVLFKPKRKKKMDYFLARQNSTF